MEKQVQRLASNLTSLLSSPSKKQTTWLQMELILLSQKKESITCSLAPLTKAVSNLLNHENPELSKLGLSVFVKLFCFRSEWLEQFFREEMLERGAGICFLNIGVLKTHLDASMVKMLKSMARTIDCTQKALVLIDVKGLQRDSPSPPNVKVIDFKNKTYSGLLKAIEKDFPCLVGLVYPSAEYSTPQREIASDERASEKKNPLSSGNTASTAKTRKVPQEFEKVKVRHFTPGKEARVNKSTQKGTPHSRATSYESTNSAVNDRQRKSFYNPYMHPYPSYVINIYSTHRHSSLNYKTKLRGFGQEEEKINLTEQLKNRPTTVRKLKSDGSHVKKDAAATEKKCNAYRNISSEKRSSYAQRFILNDRARKRFAF